MILKAIWLMLSYHLEVTERRGLRAWPKTGFHGKLGSRGKTGYGKKRRRGLCSKGGLVNVEEAPQVAPSERTETFNGIRLQLIFPKSGQGKGLGESLAASMPIFSAHADLPTKDSFSAIISSPSV